jgi:Zn-dependent M28 family amino/carboxypeptidase
MALLNHICLKSSTLFIFGLAYILTSCFRPAFNGSRALNYLNAQLSYGYRIPGSQSSRETSVYIRNILEDNGWEVNFQDFVFEGVTLRNIVASKNNSNPKIIFGTHYDTRQISDQESSEKDQFFPVLGANDGASGAALLLEMSHHLDSQTKNITLVFFDGEDQGRIDSWPWSIGAEYFAANMNKKPEKVVIVDMIGDKELEIFIEKNSTKDLAGEIWTAAEQAGYREYFVNDEKYSLIDDHLPFINRGIPAVLIIDFDYPFWHTNNDAIDKVSPESLVIVGEVLLNWIRNFN